VFSHSDPKLNEEARKYGMNFTKSLQRYQDKFSVNNIDLYTKPIQSLNIKQLLTARIQLQLPVITDRMFGSPHLDGIRDFPYRVAVYYVNDSDGDTCLYKQTDADVPPDKINSTEFDIDKNVQPKKGRLIVFDGNIYHSSGKPKQDVRCIINYNFI
jgi:hypothetical protein